MTMSLLFWCFVILRDLVPKATLKGERCSHARMAITEPKRLGLSPIQSSL